MLIDIPDNRVQDVMVGIVLRHAQTMNLLLDAFECALATEKADTKYVDELIAHSYDTTCYNAYQFITGVENRRRLLDHLNRLQSVEVNRCVRCDNVTNYKQTLCSDCDPETVKHE